MRTELGRGTPGYAPNRGNQVSAVDGRQLRGVEAGHELRHELVELMIREMQHDSGHG